MENGVCALVCEWGIFCMGCGVGSVCASVGYVRECMCRVYVTWVVEREVEYGLYNVVCGFVI